MTHTECLDCGYDALPGEARCEECRAWHYAAILYEGHLELGVPEASQVSWVASCLADRSELTDVQARAILAECERDEYEAYLAELDSRELGRAEPPEDWGY